MLTANSMNEITTNSLKNMSEWTRKRIEQWLLEDKIEEKVCNIACAGGYGTTIELGSLPEAYKYAACEYFDKLGYYVESGIDDCIHLNWGEDANLEEY